jgi:hypothetical protein
MVSREIAGSRSAAFVPGRATTAPMLAAHIRAAIRIAIRFTGGIIVIQIPGQSLAIGEMSAV